MNASLRRLRAPTLAARVVLAALAAGCGSGGGPAEGGADDPGSSSPYLVDKDIDEAAWKAVVAADSALTGLAGEVGLAWRAAGAIEDSAGARLTWAEYAADPDGDRETVVGLFVSCDAGGECRAGRATYTALGAELVYADGSAVERLPIGLPTNAKQLAESGLDSGEVIALPLKANHVVDPGLSKMQVDASTWGRRRLLVLSAWGPQTGVKPGGWSTGSTFDELLELSYVRRRDIHRLFPQMTPLDVVVWMGAGVVNPHGPKPHRSVGITVSRGVVGDSVFTQEDLGQLLDAPPLGGPGLVILAGSDSLSGEGSSPEVFANALHLGPYRPVVGIRGRVSITAARQAARALLERLEGGATLDRALAASTPEGGSWGTPLPISVQEKWTLPAGRAAFWESAPTSARLEMYVKMDMACAEIAASGTACNAQSFQAGYRIPPEKLTPIPDTKFICEPTLDGPYFQCGAKNTATFTDFWLKGLLTGRGPGASIFVYARGSPDARVTGIAVVGAGTVESVDRGGGTTTLSFGGPAAASTFVNGDGQCCIVKGPSLSGHASHLLSKLILIP